MCIGLLAVACCNAGAGPVDAPAAVIRELRSRGCKGPHETIENIIHGEYIKLGQTDWVALCSTKSSTQMLVFPQGKAEQIAVLETHPKGFSRWTISTIDRAMLKRMNAAWAGRGPELREVDHDGIRSVVATGEPGGCLYCYSEEQSVHYWQQGQWLTPEQVEVN